MRDACYVIRDTQHEPRSHQRSHVRAPTSAPRRQAAAAAARKAAHPLRASDPRIIVGPRTGEDAAVFDFGDRYLVAKTDPITFATSEIGWYAVNVNANDVAVMGAAPRWFLATVLLPAGQATAEMAERIFSEISDACAALGVSLAGGHTEITHNLDRPIICGTMLGEIAKERLITTAGARPGDVVLLVKAVPIEGTALIALGARGHVARPRLHGGVHRPRPGIPEESGHQRGRASAAGRRDCRRTCDARPDRRRRDDRAAGNGAGGGERNHGEPGCDPRAGGECAALPGVRAGSAGDDRIGRDPGGGAGG